MRCETLHPNQNTLSKPNVYALVTMNIIVGISNIVLNTTIAYSLWKTKMIKTISFKFVFLLSISDCMIGLAVCPVIVSLLIMQQQPFCVLEHFAQSLTFMICQFSGIMVVIITLDRYLHMKYLTRYNTHMTKRRASFLIGMNLNSCFVTGVVLTLATMNGFIFQFEVVLVSVYSALVCVIFLLYSKTFLTLRQRVNEMSTIHSKSRNDAESRQKAELIFAKGMIFVLLCTALCYTPCFLSGTIWAHRKYVKKEEPPQWLHSTLFWTCVLMYANSSFNPIAMLTFNTRLREYVRNFVLSKIARSGRSESSEVTEIFHIRRDATTEVAN